MEGNPETAKAELMSVLGEAENPISLQRRVAYTGPLRLPSTIVDGEGRVFGPPT